MAGRRWRVRLGAAAEVDFANILKWTAENFGERQTGLYRDTLLGALGELANGPDVPAPGRGTRSCRACARFTSRAGAAAEVIF
jgi:plasmid stabilization system protein ParE